MSVVSVCPTCQPDNPAARYADTCLRHHVEDELPAHYIGCDRLNVYGYGTTYGKCDCTATADFEALLRALATVTRHADSGEPQPVTPPRVREET